MKHWKKLHKKCRFTVLFSVFKKETIQTIAHLLETKALKPHIHQNLVFRNGKAHTEVETGRVVGKVIVNV